MLLGLAMLAGMNHAAAQGTAFTYQGQLTDGTSPANGSYDFRFRLATDPLGNIYAGQPFLTNGVPVTHGQFVTTIDFGGLFTGSNYWLEVDVRTNGGPSYTSLLPLQAITPTAYAIFANTASNLLGTLPATRLTGAVPLANLPAAVLTNNETGVTLGNVTIGGNLNVPANATLTSGGNSFLAGLNVDPNNLNVGNVNANSLTFGTSSGEGLASKRSGANAYDLELWTDFHNRMTVSQNGNVGIGTANPAASLLEVNGDVRIDANRLLLEAGGGTGNGLVYASSGLNFVPTGAGTFLFGYNGGALGTADPNAVALAWDWHGNVWASNNITISAALNIDQVNGNVGTVAANALTFGQNSGEGIGSKRSGTHPYDLEFYTDFNNRMTIANNGNVGINTIAATETLEINGTSRIDDNDMYLRTGTDHNHGLGYRATVSGTGVDGPFLYGYSGGVLGTSNPESIALRWDRNGDAWVNNNLSTATLTIRGGADVAEPFPVTGSQVEPGTVMVIDEANPGQLSRSTQAYDTRVAGIISGAGGVKPGLELQQDGVLDQGQKVALSGRVYVQADASLGAIRPGDLLTTSDVPGCAMRVSDHARAQGAILGKAMTGLKDGRGLVLVLVTLQ